MEHIIETIAPASSGVIAWKKSSIKCASAMGGHVNPHFISHSLHDPGNFFHCAFPPFQQRLIPSSKQYRKVKLCPFAGEEQVDKAGT